MAVKEKLGLKTKPFHKMTVAERRDFVRAHIEKLNRLRRMLLATQVAEYRMNRTFGSGNFMDMLMKCMPTTDEQDFTVVEIARYIQWQDASDDEYFDAQKRRPKNKVKK